MYIGLLGLCIVPVDAARAAWLIRRDDPQARPALRQFADKVERTHSFRHFPWDVYEVTPAAEAGFAAQIQSSGAQASISRTYRLAAVPNDPRYTTQQTELAGPAPDADIYLEEAWDITTDTRSLAVAIIDSGMKLNHPDLAGSLWVNAAEASGTAGIDDDGNGRIDDLNGWDFTTNSPILSDALGHGTSVAGVIGAQGNNGIGIAGTAWGARLMILRSFQGNETDEIHLLNAIDYALDFPEVRILNASWGDYMYSAPIRAACEALRDAGVLLVCAAGNDNLNIDSTPYYPASFNDLENIVSVAAINGSGGRASFSNYGLSVSLAAPGSAIETTSISGSEYGKVNGTSFAAPRVSGAAALFFAQYPHKTAAQARRWLIDGSRHTSALSSTPLEGGLLDLMSLLTPPPAAAGAWTRYE